MVMKKASSDLPIIMTPEEVAEVLRISVGRLANLRSAGESSPPYHKRGSGRGGKVLYYKHEVAAYLNTLPGVTPISNAEAINVRL